MQEDPGYLKLVEEEPYRLFFPMGIAFLLWGILIWLPPLQENLKYPVYLHRLLMLNGFVAHFVGGFLMTAIPRFSQTERSNLIEVGLYILVGILGFSFHFLDIDLLSKVVFAGQPLLILAFMAKRMAKKKKRSPPSSFIFVLLGLVVWLISSIGVVRNPYNAIFQSFLQEGFVMAMILGVGSRLLPGIMGHAAIVPGPGSGKNSFHFLFFAATFVASYFLPVHIGPGLRAALVSGMGLVYWKLYKAPVFQTSLTWSLWLCAWAIVLSFILKALWPAAGIHVSHSFFLAGVVLLSLLIATRVIQSHGPKDESLENKKILLMIVFLTFLAAIGRVFAFAFSGQYFLLLGGSSALLILVIILWSSHYLKFVLTSSESSES